MKKQVSPSVVVVVLAFVVVGAAVLLWRVSVEKPTYPGMNAGHPAAEVAGGAKQISGHANVPHGEPVTFEQAKKMHIPGMSPSAKPPPGMKTGQ
jgi:hypothetical protein